ncbi:DUF3649 domain-containing protein [Alcaligenes faecalis]|uniref:DUF3649 domain-containing protein n=1 Tax=Alcaligenes phenolicus TaxID=232846 RepID=UPI002CEBEB90|nr:DUF3649 domain-containing protein [Alcaligenes phenolicus]HRO20760.1 DUF3649 domain-containing protein [Alcaligenes phenolicus]HRP13592.1 DUF3649 domain-containing protein [Alcaligenes phenolicus]
MSGLTSRYRLQVLSRIVAATVGGYALAAAATVLLTVLWPLPRAQAVLAANMLSFVWYTIAVMWVFSTKSATRAWVGMVLPTALIALLSVLLMPAGVLP